MSVIVEFTISTDDFVFGAALSTVEDMDIELEAIVPTGERVVPYFWATGKDFDAFEQHLLEDADIEGVTQLDRIRDSALYRVQWVHDVDGLLDGLATTEAVVLESVTFEEGWYFRVRFPNHDLLGQFYNYCTERGIAVHVERVYTLAEASAAGRAFDLTPEQREALVIAVRKGYFEVPRRTDLSAVGDQLGISQQAASNRIRRGANKVLSASLLKGTSLD